MLKRRIYEDLLNFKNSNANKCLILDGARQVGKSYIIDEVFSKEYESYLKIDFHEKESNKNIFDGDIDAEGIIKKIKLFYPEFNVVKGNTLIFLDEIQDCSKAIVALKYLASYKDIDVVCSGSSLGLSYKADISYPVGYVINLKMHSLDFREFLWAKNIDNVLIDDLKKYFDNPNSKVIDKAILSKMNEYFKEYLVVGGMPEVVCKYIETNDFNEAHNVQKRIYHDYISHIATYASAEIKTKATSAYKSIPSQLSKDNHKFQYSYVEKKGTARKFETSVDWLINANIVNKICNVKCIDYPLESFSMQDNFRLYYNDIGLLMATYDISIINALVNDSFDDEPAIELGISKGPIYEALIADLLFKKDYDHIYFYRNEPGTIEIEFLIENTLGIVPIEIKAGRTGTKSLNQILENEKIKIGYKLSNQKNGQINKKITLPLFMILFI